MQTLAQGILSPRNTHARLSTLNPNMADEFANPCVFACICIAPIHTCKWTQRHTPVCVCVEVTTRTCSLVFAFASLVKTSFLFELRGEGLWFRGQGEFSKKLALVICFFTLYRNCLWQVRVENCRFSFWFSFVQRGKVQKINFQSFLRKKWGSPSLTILGFRTR